jgi:hypothetical protein
MSAPRFTLTIRLANDEMRTPANIAEALTELAQNMRHRTAGEPYEPITLSPSTRISGNIHDINGGTVGRWDVTA